MLLVFFVLLVLQDMTLLTECKGHGHGHAHSHGHSHGHGHIPHHHQSKTEKYPNAKSNIGMIQKHNHQT